MSKVWLITGSSRSLGRTLAERVLEGGDRLVATARDPAQLANLVARYGDRVRIVALDVRDAHAAAGAVQTWSPPLAGSI
jgi:NADP-dependent 3-hydroxy acid dehydrogenase YdfG